MGQLNPAVHLCECGCGQPTLPAKATDRRAGAVKGQPTRFIRGHASRGSNNPGWRGDEAGYQAIHIYLRRNFPKAGACDGCRERKPTDYALIKGRAYTRNRDDYRELCKGCHLRYDDLGYARYWRLRGQSSDPVGTAPECACGCGTVTEWQRKNKRWSRYAVGHYRTDAPYKDGAWLRSQYVDMRRSIAEIAAECDVTRNAVKAYMVRFGIERRSPADSHMRTPA